jgi:hypothetical protein
MAPGRLTAERCRALDIVEVDPDDLGLGFVPAFRDEVEFVPVGEEAVLYVEETGRLLQLDPIGAVVCRLFDGRTSIDAATDELAEAFEAPREVVANDVQTFVAQVGRFGLLVGVRPSNEDDERSG